MSTRIPDETPDEIPSRTGDSIPDNAPGSSPVPGFADREEREGLLSGAKLYQELDRAIEAYRDVPGSLIAVLHRAQEIFGYLPETVQIYIAEKLDVPISKVYGVVTFYSLFSTEPRGRHRVEICLGTACYVKGAARLRAELEKELGIRVGGMTRDKQFSLETTRCIGACGLAPVVTVDGKVHGQLQPEDVGDLLARYRLH